MRVGKEVNSSVRGRFQAPGEYVRPHSDHAFYLSYAGVSAVRL